jgi:hypothetical protein
MIYIKKQGINNKKAGAEQFSGYSTPTIDKEPQQKTLHISEEFGASDRN